MFTGKIEKLVYINNKILRNFQLNAIETILEAFKNGHLKVSANLLPGTGKSLIIAEVLKTLFENKVVNRVVFLSGRKIIQQERTHFYENNYPDLLISEDFETFRSGILMKTISFIDDEFNSNDFDLIITDDFCQTTLKSEYLEKILNSDAALLSLNNGFGETYFSNSSKVFNLKFDKYQQYIEFSEDIFVQDFVKPLFSKLGFNNLYYQKRYKLNDHILRPDFVAFDKNGNAELLCEVKYYRDRVLSQGLYHTIVYKFCKYKSAVNAKHNILLLLSNVDKNSKAELFENFGIIIWDLSNLLYLTQGDLDLYKRLLTVVNYPINDIIPEKPYKYEEVCKKETDFSQEECKQKNYIQKLKKCSYGKEDEADKKFENLCIDIIDYLFEGEFRKIKPQQTCSDNLHRVDLLVGIKGTKEFWDLLIKHYNTRFVVFEFKNYKEELKQNLIYTTEKYLYNVALRNVAIIISRKGFSENAQKAANGCLRENGKLILDLSEDDLISMLEGKEEGQEPSEYLYQKLEDLLISVGK